MELSIFCYTNFVSSGVIPGPLVRLCHFPNPVPSEKVVREVELLEVRQDRVELGKALVVNVGIGQVETADPEQIFIFKIGVVDISLHSGQRRRKICCYSFTAQL